MRKAVFAITLVLAVSLLMWTGNARATLIGLELGLPDIFSDSTGTYSYNAGTDLFTSTATALTITFDGITNINIVGGSYSVSFLVDEYGNFAGGVGGDDLVITGDIDVNGDGSYDYTGTLVAGEVTNFGWNPLIPTDYALFDFTFDFKDGALASFYALNDDKGGNTMFVEETDFTGAWTVSHESQSSGVKHDTAPVPEPASLLLLGSGLVGLAGYGWQRKKKQS